MKRSTALAFFATLVLPASAFSQFEACPGGTQVGQECRGGSCVPICAYGESSQQQAAPRPRIVDRYQVWDDRWGAIASDKEGPLGVTEGKTSEDEAKRAASEDCVARGGDANRCLTIAAVYRNACGAYAWGGGRGVASAKGIEVGQSIETVGRDAEREALEICSRDAGVECGVVYSGCSHPVERWTYEKPPGWVPAE